MLDTILRRPPFVLLDDSRPRHMAGGSYLYHSPDKLIIAETPADVTDCLDEIDKAIKDGFYVAGYCAYEMAASLEGRVSHIAEKYDGGPLLWMMVTKERELLSSEDLEELFFQNHQGSKTGYDLQVAEPSLSRDKYTEYFDRIQSYIQSGDIYQVNFTFPISVTCVGDSLALYQDLRESQPVPYGAFIHTGDQVILSLSPELFVEKTGEQLRARPMKGTIARGLTSLGDQQNENFLKSDIKSQAENLMIVDLLRNDLSRVAKAGSVSVPKLFETAVYRSVIQMTSDVICDADSAVNHKPSKLLRALFPCGSVTGAPKIRAMQVIHELEHTQGHRGVYCGAIGHFEPVDLDSVQSYNATFNVPIRTLTLQNDNTDKLSGRFHVGSGIVSDSDACDEYDECLLKGKFLTGLYSAGNTPDFTLFETMRLSIDHAVNNALNITDCCPDWQYHYARIKDSSTYFQIPFDQEAIVDRIEGHIKVLRVQGKVVYRLKLQMDQQGEVIVETWPMTFEGDNQTLGAVSIHPERLNSQSLWLYHKTSNRPLYTESTKKALDDGLLDYIFLNEEGQVCEGAISSVFIQMNEGDDQLLTPALSCGLLPGTLRQKLLDSGEAIEAILYPKDLKAAHKIYIGNSLRGLRPVTLKD